MFFQQPTPPPPLHSLILQSILQHLNSYGDPFAQHSTPAQRPIPGYLPPAQQGPVQGTRPAPGPVQPPQTGPVQGTRPAPGPYQPPNTSPYGIQGGGLHRLVASLL